MAELKSLIRLKSHQLDQKKRALAELYKQRDEIQKRKDDMLEQMQNERQVADADGGIDAQMSYLRYAENVKIEIERIDQDLAKLDDRISKAQDIMRDAFAELKKIETVQERREQEEEDAQRKKEDQEMDDIGIEQHRRQNEEQGS